MNLMSFSMEGTVDSFWKAVGSREWNDYAGFELAYRESCLLYFPHRWAFWDGHDHVRRSSYQRPNSSGYRTRRKSKDEE